MTSESHENVQRLRKANLVASEEIPNEYAQVFNGLSREQISMLIELKQALDQAEADSGTPASSVCPFPP